MNIRKSNVRLDQLDPIHKDVLPEVPVSIDLVERNLNKRILVLKLSKVFQQSESLSDGPPIDFRTFLLQLSE